MRIISKHFKILAFIAFLASLSILVAFFVIFPAWSQVPTVVPLMDTSSPVYASKCTPCHRDFDAFKNPNIIFKHAYHLLVECQGCHIEFPHQPWKTIKPTMESCYSCHGLRHSRRGLIGKKDCRVCHPGWFNLVPAFHTPQWRASTHKNEPNFRRCMMCHSASSCEGCHAKRGIRPLPAETYTYETILPEPAVTRGYEIQLGLPITSAKCAPCHRDLDAFKNPALIFDHDVHLERAIRCEVCHSQFPHLPDVTLRPPMDSCYNCHSLRHSKQGLVAPEECGVCHPREFNLVPITHTIGFRTKTHKDDAKTNMDSCLMCHDVNFCNACHTAKGVKPLDHTEKPEVWRTEHGKQKAGVEGCVVCHRQKYCDDCHRTPIPHSLAWMGVHKDAPPDAIGNCRMCHKEREFCQECHHTTVAKAILIRDNCTKCHPEYRVPFLEVRRLPIPPDKRKAFMVHIAHCEMTQTEPFRCPECHERKYPKGTGCFSFELCYSCHGKVRLGKLIAKWGGTELCYKCHLGPR
ncbi:MAG: cytochrome c3 family protein [Actinomycetota bacterium]|nr:cytochrome c3 family protein [Actinomycetota bacterium]